MTHQEKINKAKAYIVLKHPFFASLLLRLRFYEVEWCPTACTDGQMISYNKEFMAKLSEQKICGLFCHEVMHIVLGHHLRRGNRHPVIWNIAGDHAINLILKDAGIDLPDNGCCDKKYAGMTADRIYDLIYEDLKDQYNQCQQNGDGSGDGQGNQGAQGAQGAQGNQDNKPGQGKGFPGHDPGKCGVVMDAPGTTNNPQEAKRLEEELRIQIIQAAQIAKSAGKYPGGLAQVISEIVETKVSWKEILKELTEIITRDDYSWQRQNRRYAHAGVYLPELYNRSTGSIAVALDTSGSISDQDLKYFLSELSSLIQEIDPECVHCVQFDAAVQDYTEYSMSDLPLTINFKGRGGTDFRPIFTELEERELEPEYLIVFTDMYGSYPDQAPSYPVIWLNNYDQNYNPPFGEMIYVNMNER